MIERENLDGECREREPREGCKWLNRNGTELLEKSKRPRGKGQKGEK